MTLIPNFLWWRSGSLETGLGNPVTKVCACQGTPNCKGFIYEREPWPRDLEKAVCRVHSWLLSCISHTDAGLSCSASPLWLFSLRVGLHTFTLPLSGSNQIGSLWFVFLAVSDWIANSINDPVVTLTCGQWEEVTFLTKTDWSLVQ